MKKQRTQWVFVYGRRQTVDIPIDDELYKADRRREYQREKSKDTEVSLDEDVFADLSMDLIEAYEKKQLIKSLHQAMKTLTADEHQLVDYIYNHELTEREVAAILEIDQSTVTYRKHKILKKLRRLLKDWF